MSAAISPSICILDGVNPTRCICTPANPNFDVAARVAGWSQRANSLVNAVTGHLEWWPRNGKNSSWTRGTRREVMILSECSSLCSEGCHRRAGVFFLGAQSRIQGEEDCHDKVSMFGSMFDGSGCRVCGAGCGKCCPWD